MERKYTTPIFSPQKQITNIPQSSHSYSLLSLAEATAVKVEWDSQMLAHLHRRKRIIKLIKFTTEKGNQKGTQSAKAHYVINSEYFQIVLVSVGFI